MKEMKIFTLAISIILLTITVILPFGFFDGDSFKKEINEKYTIEDTSINSINDIVFVSIDMEENQPFDLSKNIRKQSDFGSIGKNDVVLIDGAITKNMKELKTSILYDNIDTLIENSNPVIVIANDPGLITNRDNLRFATAFTDEADVFCIYYESTTGATHSHSITGRTIEESLSIAYKWTKDLLIEDKSLSSGNDINFISPPGTYWALAATSNVTKTCEDFGMMSVKSFHYMLMGYPRGTNYVMTSYQLQGEPFDISTYWDRYNAVADMGIANNLSNRQELMTYSPTASGGNTTIGVNMNIGVSGNGVSGNIGGTWSYTVPDIVFHNDTSYSSNKFDVWYDFNEKGVNKTNTQEIRPGMLTSGYIDGRWPYLYEYNETDVYKITFYRDRHPSLMDMMETFTESVRVYIPF